MTITKKIVTFLTLALCAGLFLFPAEVSANAVPPSVMAWINGDSLHIQIWNGDFGVETVYIDNSRVSYRDGGSFAVPARSYAGTGEYISVCCVDSAGNWSNTIMIDNPYYVTPAAPPAMPYVTPRPVQGAESAVVTPPPQTTTVSSVSSEQRPFTFDGTGTVLDNAQGSDGKEFFTITTEDENEFFLVVDRQRNADNVYLLDYVTEEDLLSLAQSGGGTSRSAVPAPSPAPVPTPQPTPEPAPRPTPEPEVETPASGNAGAMVIIALVVLGVGGAGYYFKIVKPRREAPSADDEDYDDEDYPEDEDTGGDEE